MTPWKAFRSVNYCRKLGARASAPVAPPDSPGELEQLRRQLSEALTANEQLRARLSDTSFDLLDDVEGGDWCEIDFDDLSGSEAQCAVEPPEDFRSALWSRASWLVGLLVAQSLSSFILQGNTDLLQVHSWRVERVLLVCARR